MKTSVRILLIVAAVALSVCAGFYLHLRGPSHKGKTLNQWLEQLARSQSREEAKAALIDMGASGQKHLLALLQAKDSEFENKVATILGMSRDDAHSRRMSAARGFQALGPAAEGSLPQLIELLKQDDTSLYAAEAMATMGPQALPQLTAVLESGGTQSRLGAAILLARTGPAAEPALPALMKSLKADSTADVRAASAMALGTIGKDPANSVPALAEALKDKAESVQARAAEALGKFGPAAKPAVPPLLTVALSRGREAPGIALEAIGKIDPASVPKARQGGPSPFPPTP